MAAGYDGTIRIDSSIDDKGFNAGMGRMGASAGKSLGSIIKSLGGVKAVLTLVGLAIGAAFGFLVSLAGMIFGSIQKIVEVMSRAVSQTSAYGQQLATLNKSFADLKGALFAAFSPIVTFITPIIINIVNWLVKMLNVVSMIVAALLGQATVMQYVAGSAATASTATGNLADQTNRAAKAAKGALAPFDQLNVLQQESTQAGSAQGGAMQFTVVPVDQELVRPWVAAWLTIKEVAEMVWADIKLVVWAFFLGLFIMSDWLRSRFEILWTDIKLGWEIIGNFFGVIAQAFVDAWAGIKKGFGDAWAWVVVTWNGAKTWFSVNVLDPLKAAFQTVLEWIGNKWVTTFTGIKEFVKGSVNTIIDFINGMIKAIATGLNMVIGRLNAIKITIPSWVPVYGGSSWSVNIPTVPTPVIPHLAAGAVIPPNAQFAAILGDQRNGRNLEAPEGLIRQIIQEEIGNIQFSADLNFTGTLAQLAQILKPHLDNENIRIGNSLVRSGS